MPKLHVDGLDYKIDDVDIIRNITLSIEKGSFVGLIGPNGCGKSTLLKNIYRICKPSDGAVLIDGKNIFHMSNKSLAKEMSVMLQENYVEFDMDVMDMVLLGRYAHKKILSDTSKEDQRIAWEALEAVGMTAYAGRNFLSLSGGEKQRILIARALTQQAALILLDEPTNHLDISYQYQVMDVLKSQQGLTVFSSIHDLNLAALYCDKIICMNQGQIACCGIPEEVLTKENIYHFFGVQAQVSINPVTQKVQIYFMPRSYMNRDNE